MIIYNETFVVDEGIHEQWLAWVKENHIANIIATGDFQSHQILRVLNSPNEGVTYCIQYFTDHVDKHEHFMLYHMNPLHIAHNQQFENRFVLFNTLMEQIN
ncbi:DUF4286 family protein [Mucilaginibacter polytrichastri]|uniref:DUF4286 domain-containing protein n=1 Tax=Mucilaginibacter polytrichastri TaxID=1302689 RepID=A0A1Q6A6H8_9SPHI|nr:DUF4286 family protein [Mucilaginibacter polytrichastri]OKS89615.1 hypothetical protein RG47T_5099 [Mucilaginibacter polytrichastri]SFT24403.1 protein of unknown function [Mucilaginibacter polytrichastri]